MDNIIVTGGAGFIGSHLVCRFVKKYPNYHIINLDKLTYAGDLNNVKEVADEPNYSFIKVDIVDFDAIFEIFKKYNPIAVFHLAAESHVDRSIVNPMDFVYTNVIGTVNLLNAAKAVWDGDFDNRRFIHISTDEVYGSLGEHGYFTEQTPYSPRSPYSASKASSDHFVKAYFYTYGLPTIVTNCSNNYGPNQYPEKLLPVIINNIYHEKPLPVYGQGINIRDWLYVDDHCEALELVWLKGVIGESYNIGGNNEWRNIDLVKLICKIMDEKLNRPAGYSEKLITFVKDRLGHDLRYAIDSTKIRKELGWQPKTDFIEGLSKTIDWYLERF
ncbi:MAG TPA: dTDP-glucose 4,6-dehydratase [Bacteroidales bacterium]|nr:dTDP-glucose 4,6-dehydratase [Bacteroidales bacterium]